MRTSGKLTKHDLEEVRKFKAFLKRWHKNKLGVLQDPEMQAYLHITPQEAWKMSHGIRKVSSDVSQLNLNNSEKK